ncbi:MAG TPA: glucans biosynthesis glucosyltransferase MdoH, partial [Geminicoccaceae bacterium]|nr:glucans biosynthesis glucosyltransferase MdoH [Geminicoccaceae bacterium]
VTIWRGDGGSLMAPEGPMPDDARTALVMPIYHEDPEQVGLRLAATYRSLAATGQLAHFDVFILSDSRDPDIVAREQALWDRLCRELDAGGRLFYRNRTDNRGRKAGNIADFCRRWGGRYRYFVVLDADSVMAGPTLVRLVQLMEANPGAGLIQTVPRPVGGETLLARILQFSAGLYGPLLAAGLNYWFQNESNYWGHNAIIRTEAFMASAALPILPGSPPFGGEILSHDFVEAAFLRRAGWGVWLVPELGGSYEELPPTLSDFVNRDRRWCQGNLQHLRLLTTKGLRPASRAHLLTGAMAYLASPLWLTLLLLTSLEAARAALIPWDYFADATSFGPAWPIARRAELLGLFAATLGILMLPRFLALLHALVVPARRRAFGGAFAAVRSVLAELVFSVLLAPVLMVQHTRVVFATIMGWRVSWSGQDRGGSAEGWGRALVRYGGCTLFGAIWGWAVYVTAPDLLPWFSPVLAGLLLAVPLVAISSRADLGRAALRRGWFLIPEETAPPEELAWLDLGRDALRRLDARHRRPPLLASEPAAPSSGP